MALKRIQVIELTGLATAPFCGMILADFGASVIRVDKIHSDTEMDCLGNGKKSLSLDLKHPKGVDILRKLCKTSDVLIEPFRAGVVEQLGLGPDVLLKDNPRLIYARLTGFGQRGILSNNGGHDINFLSISGLLSLMGRRHENPLPPINLVASFAGGGLLCALGILMALFERNSSGLGQIVDNSMSRGSAYVGSWLYRSQKLPVWGQERGNNVLDTGSHFYEVYKTKDGKYMSVGSLEPFFYEQLLKGLELEEVPQFGDMETSDQLKQLFTAKFSEKTQQEWCDIFYSLDACVTPVLDIEEAPKYKHNVQQQVFVKTEDSFAPNPAPNLSRTPAVSNALKQSPSLGQHTKEILVSLGFTEENISDLENKDIVKCCKNKSKL